MDVSDTNQPKIGVFAIPILPENRSENNGIKNESSFLHKSINGQPG